MNRRPAIVLLVAVGALAGCSADQSAPSPTPSTSTSGATRADAGLGPMPTWLPSSGAAAAVRGTTSDPALSYPGSVVTAAMPGGDVRVDVEGPTYPEKTALGAPTVSVTFTVTLTKATGRVDLRDARFDLYDSAGRAHHTRVTGLPATIGPGASATATVTATVPSGEGLLRLYPGGDLAVAAWDYVAETD